MHGSIVLRSIISLVILSVCGPLSALAWEDGYAKQSCEPRIKFLDDLVGGGHVSARDPWDERIETERHDFTQSATTVGRGVSQIEMGYSYFYRDENEEIEQAHTAPETMLRLGLTEDIEFRLRWTYAWAFADEGHSVDSAEDLRWAFKLAVTDQDCWVPESGLELRFTAPTGGSVFTTEHVEWGIDYIYDWKIAEFTRFYGSTGVTSNALGDFGLLPEEPAAERFYTWSQSFALGSELTERITVYNEIYGLFSYNLIDNYSIVIYNVGVDYYVTDDFVLDFRVGAGLTADSDDVFTGFGGGFRF